MSSSLQDGPRLPWDILYRVIDAVAEPQIAEDGFIRYQRYDAVPPVPDYSTLSSLTLVCTHLLPFARKQLYKSIHLSRSGSFNSLCDTFQGEAEYAKFVRHLDIHDMETYRSEVLGVHVEQLWRFLHKCKNLQSIYYHYSNIHTMKYIQGALGVLDVHAVGIYRANADGVGEIAFQPQTKGRSPDERLSQCQSLSLSIPDSISGKAQIVISEGYELLYAGSILSNMSTIRFPSLTQLYLDSCLSSRAIESLLFLLAPRLLKLAITERTPSQFPRINEVLSLSTTLRSLSLRNLRLEKDFLDYLPVTLQVLRVYNSEVNALRDEDVCQVRERLKALEVMVLRVNGEEDFGVKRPA